MDELKQQIIEFLNSKYISHRGLKKLAEIVAKAFKQNVAIIMPILEELVREGELFQFAHNKFAGSKLLGLIKGKFSLSNQNFGFVLNEGGDIYVARRNNKGAFDGDIVLVKITSGAFRNKKREGKIVQILSRDNDGLVGTFEESGGHYFVSLDRKNCEIRIDKKYTLGAKNGDKVVVDILEYKSSIPVGRVVEVIGNLDEGRNDLKWFLRQYKVKDYFPEDVKAIAQKIPQEIDEELLTNRRDLRKEVIITIDGADAKDLDDAVCVKKNNDGTYTLGVHIADVGEYVKLNSVIDKEAFERGTSIYFVDQVIPMLPRQLSNGICSLNPNVDRLALSVEMKIDKDGKVLSSDIFESVINSKHRLNYDEVLLLLDGDKDTQERLSDIKDMLFDMLELSKILENRRNNFGALNFEIPEGEVEVDKNGKAVGIYKRVATKSTKIIETFMVVANEVVAKTFNNLGIPFVYRVHEKPDSEKMATFFDFTNTLGLKLPSAKKDIEPKDLQQILKQVEDKSVEGVVNMIMLRSLKKAKYYDKCLGHFGMALEYYCHFTSPIRRYPDLTIHRIIKEYLHKNLAFINSKEMSDFVIKSSENSSKQERLAEDVERAITDYKKCEYMEQFVGNTYQGIISGVNQRGFYVELDNTCEGLVPVSSLVDGFYNYDEQSMSIVSHNNYYKIGEKVEVKLEEVNKLDRKIVFSVIKKIR